MRLQRVRTLLLPFQRFVRSESMGGIILLLAAAVAFAWANSPWAASYQALQEVSLGLRVGGWALEKDLLHWVNDGLMAIFFFLVGLEIKRELLVGELSEAQQAILAIVAALGGMAAPALIYVLANWGGEGISGWAIPTATDIAFALGVMALLGKNIPASLKVFLTALAIVDDLGAVTIIALFYSAELNTSYLLAGGVILAVAYMYGRLSGQRVLIFVILGVLLWYCLLKSGIHSTVAGVLLALTVPMRHPFSPSELKEEIALAVEGGSFEEREVSVNHLKGLLAGVQSPLHRLEHGLHFWVALGIMPLFALLNAGVSLADAPSPGQPVTVGVFLGLVVGKPLGIFLFSWVSVRLGLTVLPQGTGWPSLLGASLLAGIGFTMSLFIATLAFGPGPLLSAAKVGILGASLMAGLLGAAVLLKAHSRAPSSRRIGRSD